MVIAVIAILAALILPALSSAKRCGWDITCVNNLKQISAAGLMYMEETGQTILELDAGNLRGRVDRLARYGVTSNLLQCPVTRPNARTPAVGNGAAGTASTVWWMWPPGTENVSGSYGMNGWLFSYDPSITGGVPWLDPPLHPLKLTRSSSSQSQRWFGSRPGRLSSTTLCGGTSGLSRATRQRPTSPPARSDTIWGMPRCTIWRHGGKTAVAPVPVTRDLGGYHIPVRAAINIGFADGHAEMVRVKDLWSLYWHDAWRGP